MLSVAYKLFMLSVVMLNVVMLNVIMLNVVMLSVVKLNVVAPFHVLHLSGASSQTLD
jgi:hypothetical protein